MTQLVTVMTQTISSALLVNANMNVKQGYIMNSQWIPSLAISKYVIVYVFICYKDYTTCR